LAKYCTLNGVILGKETQSLARGAVQRIAVRTIQSRTSTASSVPVLQDVRYNKDSNVVVTQWQTGEDESTSWPCAWLRDNCRCDDCFLGTSGQRLLIGQLLDPNVTSLNTQVTDGNLNIEWSDGHRSSYCPTFLYERRFTESNRAALVAPEKIHDVFWNTERMMGRLPTDTFHNLLTDDEALYAWIRHLEGTGIFLITETPTEKGMIEKLANKVAFLRTTNYGRDFNVHAKVNSSNAAYTSRTLGLHTDLPFYMYCPGMQMLHCIKQVETKGGDNQFTDGFYVANWMKEHHPVEFDILCKTPVRWADAGTDFHEFHLLYTVPIISLDDDGNVSRITYNNQARDSTMLTSVDDTISFYRAMRLWDDLLFHENNHIKFKLAEGEIICFHNFRVLHGRTGYKTITEGERILQGGYLDWDELMSRRRLLQNKLGYQKYYHAK